MNHKSVLIVVAAITLGFAVLVFAAALFTDFNFGGDRAAVAAGVYTVLTAFFAASLAKSCPRKAPAKSEA